LACVDGYGSNADMFDLSCDTTYFDDVIEVNRAFEQQDQT
jgi:hypothetical protein